MILRKPYAFFIKHFKLLHFILIILMFYSIYNTKQILDFFNEYSMTNINLFGQDLIEPLFPKLLQFMPFLITIILLIILFVLAFKKKPFVFYLFLILSNIYNGILFQIALSTVYDLTTKVVDTRIVMLVRDLIFISFIIQLVGIIITSVRAVGFDIKKFEFDIDLRKIDITEEDREEVEVQINFDKNLFIRNLRKRLRFIKYAYLENKLFSNIAILIGVLLVTIIIIFSLFDNTKVINQKEYFTGNNLTLNISESYLTNTDYKGNKISEDFYLILKMNIKNNSTSKNTLDFATTKIVIDEYTYTPITQFQEKFSDFGQVYKGENINQEFEEKILIYQLPKELINKDIIFSFTNKNKKYQNGEYETINVKIEYENLIGINNITEYKLNEEMNLKDSILPDAFIKIQSFDIQKKYKLKYNFCLNDNCYDSYEYLLPKINSNYDKALLKISGNLNGNINGVIDLYDFIYKFGELHYTIDGIDKVQLIDLAEVNSKHSNTDGTYYIEVVDEVKNATNISFWFKIRNKVYKYILK